MRRHLAVLAVLGLAALAPARADAAGAVFFPGPVAPPTQVARDLTLQQAAQAGVIQLSAKGGYNGDAVQIEVKGTKRVKAPVTLTLRVEWHLPARYDTLPVRTEVWETISYRMQQTMDDFNGKGYKTKAGEPFRLRIETRFRLSTDPPATGFHQAELLNPRTDITPPPAKPDEFRASAGHGIPNGYNDTREVTFGTNDFMPSGITHEFLHMSGIDDQYEDTYTVGGKTYSLPVQDPSAAQLTAFRKTFTPPLKAGGKLGTRNLKTAGRCDIMGVDVDAPCHRMRQADIDFLAGQAGTQVTAAPGDVLLNKDEGSQDMGVGFTTIVFASPGSSTTANGISAYCLDHDKSLPIGVEGFDVAPASAALPGFDGIAKLLAVSGEVSTGLDALPEGMQSAVWNLSDGRPLETLGYADEARALMAQAGVTENTAATVAPDLVNPNAGTAETGAVGGDGATLPVLEGEPITQAPPAVRPTTVGLYPNVVRARRRARSQLLAVAAGPVSRLSAVLQRKAGRRYKRVRSLGSQAWDGARGRAVLPVRLGRLKRGRYRVTITLTDAAGAKTVRTTSLRAR